MDYKLANVLVTSVQDLGSGNDGTTDQQVTLRLSKIEWDYTPYDETGQPGDTVTSSWTRANRTGSGGTAPAVDVGNASGQAFVAYLKLDGVTGESHDANHTAGSGLGLQLRRHPGVRGLGEWRRCQQRVVQ